MKQIVLKWLRYRWWIAGGWAGILVVLFLVWGEKIRITHHLEEYYSHGDETFRHLQVFYRHFGRDDVYVFVLVKPEVERWQDVSYRRRFRDTLIQIRQQLRQLIWVYQVYDVVSLRLPDIQSGLPLPFLREDLTLNPVFQRKEGWEEIFAWWTEPLRIPAFVFVLIIRPEYLDSVESRYASQLAGVFSELGLTLSERVCIVGKIWTESLFLQSALKEMLVYSGAGLLLIMGIGVWMIRPWKLLGAMLLTLLGALVWTVVWMAVVSPKVPVVVTVLPAILLISALSDWIHIALHYSEELTRVSSPVQAMWRTLRKVWRSTFFTSITTAVGFWGLLISPVPAIRWLGFHAGVSVLLAYVATIIWGVPLLMAVHQKFVPGPGYRGIRQFLLQRVLLPAHERKIRWMLRGGLTIVFLIIALGWAFLRQEAYIMDDVSPGHPVRAHYECVRAHQRYVRIMEWVFRLKEPGMVEAYLSEIQRLETALREVWQSSDPVVLGPATLDQHLPSPELRRIFWRHPFFRMIDTTGRWFRIRLLLPDSGDHHMLMHVEKARKVLDSLSAGWITEFFPTGFMYAFGRAMLLTGKRLLEGVWLVVGVVGILVWLLTRRLRLVLLFTLANLMPLVVLGGMMGWLGISLRATTATLFTIAYGLVVDSTAHILFVYRWHRDRPDLLVRAITFVSVSSVFFGGVFLLLTSSSFLLTQYMGMFLLMALGSTLLVDVLLIGSELYRRTLQRVPAVSVKKSLSGVSDEG